jgi:branched-chain amino acid transport system substrate-binding protein
MLEGYGAAKMLTAAIESCGADVTRDCVEEWLKTETYDGDGLFIPRSFKVQQTPPPELRNCINVAQWQDDAANGQGGWETQVDDMTTNCFDVPMLSYPAG